MIVPAPVWAVASGICYGTSDFAGGMASRRSDPLAVVFVTQLVGTAIAAVLLLLAPKPLPSPEGAAWAALTGVAVAVGLLLLFKVLSSGVMGLAAPAAGVSSSLLPVAFSFLIGEALSELQLIGASLAIASTVLASTRRIRGSVGLGWAVLGGAMVGVAYVGIDRAQSVGVADWWLALIFRGTACAISGFGLLALGVRPNVAGRSGAWVVFGSAADSLGFFCFITSNRLGSLGPAVVLSALYPIWTAVLAFGLLHERLSRQQTAAVLLALLAIALMALPSTR